MLFRSAPRVERRHAHQHERIADGVRSGQITRHEVRKLRRAEAKMRRAEARLRRTEARMRAGRYRLERERARLQRQLDRQSQRIWRFKHNGRYYVL